MADQYPQLQVSKIVDEVKSQGVFDQLRRDFLSDVENDPAFNRLKGQVDQYCLRFLAKNEWKPGMNKNDVRDKLRDELIRAEFVKHGVKQLIDRLFTASKIRTDLYPPVERIVYDHLGLPPPSSSSSSSSSSQRRTAEPNNDHRHPKTEESSAATSIRRSDSSDEFNKHEMNPSKRARSDDDHRVEETGPPSQLPSEAETTSTYETPVQDESCPPPVDPGPSSIIVDKPPVELNTSEELSVQWHVAPLSPNPDSGNYDGTVMMVENNENEFARAYQQAERAILGDGEIESPAHEAL